MRKIDHNLLYVVLFSGLLGCSSGAAPAPSNFNPWGSTDLTTFVPDGGAKDSATTDTQTTDSGTPETDVGPDPCDPNPCNEPNKSQCSAGPDGAVCGCDKGYIANGQGVCEPNCEPDGPPPAPQAGLKAGDLLFTELMINPEAVSDGVGEWLEIRNMTDKPIVLDGLILSEQAGVDEHTIHPCKPLTVPAKGVVVLGNSGDKAVNGGVELNYVYKNVSLTTSATRC